MRSEQQSVRRSAADNADFADAAFDSALGGFQLKNHAAGNDAALEQPFDFLAGDGGENSLTIDVACAVRELEQLICAEIFGAVRGHAVSVGGVRTIAGSI